MGDPSIRVSLQQVCPALRRPHFDTSATRTRNRRNDAMSVRAERRYASVGRYNVFRSDRFLPRGDRDYGDENARLFHLEVFLG